MIDQGSDVHGTSGGGGDEDDGGSVLVECREREREIDRSIEREGSK